MRSVSIGCLPAVLILLELLVGICDTFFFLLLSKNRIFSRFFLYISQKSCTFAVSNPLYIS